ncbi:MAG TPA: transposase [Desulfobacteria bacterium]|nr:transposase [Desulfobacteria bacterium]
MSGKRGMKHFGEAIIEEVLKMKENGMTNRQIAEHFNLRNVRAVKSLVNRHNRKQNSLEAGIILRPKGRPRKGSGLTTDQKKDNEIKRLKMENELLRSFLQIAGRR